MKIQAFSNNKLTERQAKYGQLAGIVRSIEKSEIHTILGPPDSNKLFTISKIVAATQIFAHKTVANSIFFFQSKKQRLSVCLPLKELPVISEQLGLATVWR